jgi:hypothetical protein
MYIEKWIIGITLALLVLATIYAFRYAKQVRAMRHCFIHFSDWAFSELKETHEFIVSTFGKDKVVSFEKMFEQKWLNELGYTDQVMKRAGLGRPSIKDKEYVLEDL